MKVVFDFIHMLADRSNVDMIKMYKQQCFEEYVYGPAQPKRLTHSFKFCQGGDYKQFIKGMCDVDTDDVKCILLRLMQEIITYTVTTSEPEQITEMEIDHEIEKSEDPIVSFYDKPYRVATYDMKYEKDPSTKCQLKSPTKTEFYFEWHRVSLKEIKGATE